MAENNNELSSQLANVLSLLGQTNTPPNIRKDSSKRPEPPPKPQLNKLISQTWAGGRSITPIEASTASNISGQKTSLDNNLKCMTQQSTSKQSNHTSSHLRTYKAEEGSEIRVITEQTGTQDSVTDTHTSFGTEARVCSPPLTKGVRTMMKTKLPHSAYSCWTSKNEGEIWVGSSECDSISLVKNKGHDIRTFHLGITDSPIILSGINVKGNEYAMCVAQQEKHTVSLYVIMISDDLGKIVNQRKVDTQGPLAIFDHSCDEVATFCVGGKNVDHRIKIYDRKTMDMKYAVHLEDVGNDSLTISSVCRTKNNDYLTSDVENNVIYRHNEDGDLLDTIGAPASESQKNIPGELYRPIRVYEDDEGGVLVPCQDAVIHRFHHGKWDIVVNTKSGQHDICFDNNMMYTVYSKDFILHKIKK